MADEAYRVTLNVYDLSQGLARQLSTSFLGKSIEAIWHTGLVVYGNEYYFGGGIQHCPAGTTPYGTPIRVVELGVTHIPQEVFEGYLEEISPRYTAETYSLLTNNCNNFSNEVAQFLVGVSIPNYILQLPNEVMSSPMGAVILPMIQQLEATMRSGAVPQAPQFRPQPFVQPSQLSNALNGSLNAVSKKSNVDSSKAAEVKKSEEPSSNTTKEQAQSSLPSGAQDTATQTSKDALGNARSKLQEEITREFAAIMATGTLRASEAAALATQRVMQRYGDAITTQRG
ncbi:Desumoylating isopeptidase 1-like protein [Drosera capensis]